MQPENARSLQSAMVLHFAFAALSIVLNVVAQIVVVLFLPATEWSILISIGVGTGIGLVAKYFLDKFVIYKSFLQKPSVEARSALIYATSGAFTTAIFWAVEYGFHIVTHSDFWRYVGAVVGLTLGYTIKFFLDRKFVFVA